MEGDKKSTNLIEIRKKDAQPSKSANPTKRGYILRKDEAQKIWFQKTLSSRQEVLVECMAGEIYRYLIGPSQPKIRTAGLNVILSESVNYRSFREILGGEKKHPEYRNYARDYKNTFILDANIDGFVRVLFSSIFLEENDLSDQNYGLTIVSPPDTTPERYGEFIKIDHGQSLNSMRINDKSFITKPFYATAEIKRYEPEPGAVSAVDGVDSRADKKERHTIWFTRRKYNITPVFLDRILDDFLHGYINERYIWAMEFQPSALPLYDGRLLSFFRDIPESERFEKFEKAKLKAIAKIVFTKDDLYSGIGSLASHQDPAYAQKRTQILSKVLANKESLFAAIRTNLDFCYYCHLHQQEIIDDINSSYQRMIHSRKGEESDRYYEALVRIGQPHDAARLREIASVGQYFTGEIRNDITVAIQQIRDIIATHNWKIRGAGGHEIKITEKQRKVLPENAYEMARSLIRYRFSPEMRTNRTIGELAWLSHVADSKRSVWRSTETEQGYGSIRGKLESLSQRTPAIRFIRDQYGQPNSEPFLDYFKLAQQFKAAMSRSVQPMFH
ncbi:MAG: hypothetical protein ABFD98_12300 [Syntrophobacteraceae bacterium]|nr:hypothetical protein [Desulfobacteraceae bacterium]